MTRSRESNALTSKLTTPGVVHQAWKRVLLESGGQSEAGKWYTMWVAAPKISLPENGVR